MASPSLTNRVGSARISTAVRSSSGRPAYWPASWNQRLTSSWSFSGCSAARSWVSVGSWSVWWSSHRSRPKVAPAGDRAVDADRLPALVPDRPRPQHREEPGLLGRGDVVALEGGADAHGLQGGPGGTPCRS